jgi:hypothetical protein
MIFFQTMKQAQNPQLWLVIHFAYGNKSQPADEAWIG